MKRMLLTAAIILAAATSAQADDKFGTMDTDGNGVVSWEEFQKAYPQMRKPAFDAVDTDGDGSMTHDEWHGFRSRHGEGGKGMGGKSMEGMMQGMPPGNMPPSGMPLVMPPKAGEKTGDTPSPQTMPMVAPPKK
jgi:hypothetical protein